MSDWPVYSLSELCDIHIGRTPSRDNPAYWRDGEFPWLSIADMSQGRHLTTTKERISKSATFLMSDMIQPGTVVLSFKLSIGKVGIVRVPMYTNEAIAALPIKDPGTLDPNFLYWSLGAIDLTRDTDDAVMGKTLNKKKLSRLNIPLPTIDQQRKIVEILDRADALRAKRREAIARLDELTQSLFLDMFGDPGANTHCWEMRSMSELFAAPPRYGTMTPARATGEWLCLRVANIQDWKISLTDRKYVDLDPAMIDKHSVRNGDLLLARAIATREQLGKAIIARPGDGRWAFDSHLMRLRFDTDSTAPEYIQALLRTSGGRQLFLQSTRRSSVQYNINTKEITKLNVPVPPISEQRKFVAALKSIDIAAKWNESHLSRLDDLFASLQQRAFRGEL